MENTPNLELPYIMPSQAQKHVTHNEALDALDAVIQLCVHDRNRTAPPQSPADGDRHIVASPAGGAWAGQEDRIAVFRDGGWLFAMPRQGWLTFVSEEDALFCFAGGAWKPLAETLGALQNLRLFGIGTTADAANPFAARLNKALWTALPSGDGGDGDMRFTMNKQASANTASLLFQSGWAGHAEIGLAGSDDLSLKVSPDGSNWNTAYTVDRLDGTMRFDAPARFNGTVGYGTPGSAPGVVRMYRNPGDCALVLTGGADPEAPILVGQLRTAGTGIIALTNGNAGWSGVAINTGTFRVGIGVTNPVHKLTIADGTVGPATDNAHPIGTASYRWSTVYAATGIINTSDERDKDVETPIGDAAARIVDAVEPVLYRWKVGGIDVVETGTERVPDGEDAKGEPLYVERPVTEERPRPGVRLHAGWLAQDVKAAFDAEGIDCGAWGLNDTSDPDSRQWLRPDQLVAFLWEALRQTRRELSALNGRLQPA